MCVCVSSCVYVCVCVWAGGWIGVRVRVRVRESERDRGKSKGWRTQTHASAKAFQDVHLPFFELAFFALDEVFFRGMSSSDSSDSCVVEVEVVPGGKL